MKTIYYSTFTENQWNFLLARTKEGLCYVSSSLNHLKQFRQWVQKLTDADKLIEDEQALAPYKHELRTYFKGETIRFNEPLDIYGTSFQLEVWEALRQVPYGEVVTYTQIATAINNKRAVRAVASAIGKNPLLIFIPCHRVIRKSGELGGFREGIQMKKELLQLEQTFKDMVK